MSPKGRARKVGPREYRVQLTEAERRYLFGFGAGDDRSIAESHSDLGADTDGSSVARPVEGQRTVPLPLPSGKGWYVCGRGRESVESCSRESDRFCIACDRPDFLKRLEVQPESEEGAGSESFSRGSGSQQDYDFAIAHHVTRCAECDTAFAIGKGIYNFGRGWICYGCFLEH